MPRTNASLLALNRGEVSRHALARVDLEKMRLLDKNETSNLAYIRIAGGIPPGELKSVDLAPMAVAREHLARLEGLLGKYQDPRLAYLPRYAIENVEAVCDYDHLSRYREWILAGDG